MKLILLSVARENWLTAHIEPVYLKPALCCSATKAGNVQCNKDFKTQWGGGFLFWTAGNSQTKSIWNQLERGHNAGLCKGSVFSQHEKYKLETNLSFCTFFPSDDASNLFKLEHRAMTAGFSWSLCSFPFNQPTGLSWRKSGFQFHLQASPIMCK